MRKRAKWSLLACLAGPACGLPLVAPTGAVGQTREDVDASRRAVQEAIEADAGGDVQGAVRWLEEALSLHPGHPDIQVRLAGALAVAGRPDDAYRHLEAVAEQGLAPDLALAPGLTPLLSQPRFRSVAERLAANRYPSGAAADWLRVPVGADFIPEGLAHDPATGAFYLGSVRKRTILRVRRGQPPDTVARPGLQGLASVLGMVVDPARRFLWVCSTGLPQTEGIGADQEGRSAIFRFDLDTNALDLTFHFPPTDRRRRGIGDLDVDEEGRVYLSDGVGSGLYTIRPGGDFIETFVQPGTFVSPQGIAVPPAQREIYVADYSRGVYRVHRDTRTVEAVNVPPGVSLLGIDELAWHSSGLIAVQNGTSPQRVLRLVMDGDGIQEVQVLAQNLEAWEEPTMGVVVGERFYFVANSQWNRFRGADLPPARELVAPLIQWIDLGM